MKTSRIKFIIIILLSIISVFGYAGCSGEDHEGHDQTRQAAKADLYYCPMHPEVTSDKPGVCPICHMDLVKRTDTGASSQSMGNTIMLSDQDITLANISTIKVGKKKLSGTVKTFGYLDFAEPNRKTISSRFSGRIEKLFANQTGEYVKAGSPLFEIYSPDISQAQNDYLIAYRNNKNNSNQTSAMMLNSSRKKLELLGITGKQVKELEQTGEVQLTITYYSPYSGTVLEKKINEGAYVNEGTALYEIADLSVLWNITEAYISDLSYIKVGDNAEMTMQAYPGEVFKGRITFIYPVANSESRTVKVRSEFVNKGNKLKPQMFTETSFSRSAAEGIVVPDEAVIITGERNVVWVRVGGNSFSPRNVQLGAKFGSEYQVLSGLKAGEEIAATGAYLLDSESQLKGGGQTPAEEHKH
ncbi:MAG TPA: efflux RND transporter periplasmic adaptor subunit [Ignavibacteriales bacterium]|nr:efflux RND transporter periplasmic adaptor subunit [Ignavibacteriales bacterium]